MSNGKLINTLKRILFCVANVFFVFFLTFSALVCMSILWMFDTWPNLSMEELVYQLQASFEGTSRGMVGDYLLFSMPVVVIVFVVAMATVTVLRKKRKYIVELLLFQYWFLWRPLSENAIWCGTDWMLGIMWKGIIHIQLL